MDKVQVYMCLHIASIKFTAGNKTRLFLSPLLISTNWFFILAKVFRKDYVAAEENELGDYVTVPCPTKMTQRSSTAGLLKF